MADTVALARPGTEQKQGSRSAGKKTLVQDADADIKRIASSKPKDGADFGDLDIANQPPFDYEITAFVNEDNEKTFYKKGSLVYSGSGGFAIDTVSCLKQDGSQLIIGTHKGTVMIWDLVEGAQVASFQACKMVTVHKEEDDSAPSTVQTSVAADHKTTDSDSPLQKVILSISSIDLVKAPVGNASGGLLIGCATGETGIWNPQSGLCLNLWRDHTEKVAAVRFVDNSVYSVGYDGCFIVRNLEHDRVVQMFTHCTCPVSSMVVLEASSVLIGSWDGTIRHLNLKTQKVIAEYSTPDHAPVRCLAYHAPQELLFAGFGNGGIRSWDTRTQSVYVDCYVGHTDVVNCLKAHKNRLYSGSDDKTVRVWDIVKGNCLDALSGPADGVSSLELVDLGGAATVAPVVDADADPAAASSAAAQSNFATGERIIAGGFDGKVRQYRVADVEAAIETRRWRMEEGRRISAELFRKYKDEAKARKKKKGGKGGSAKGKKSGSAASKKK